MESMAGKCEAYTIEVSRQCRQRLVIPQNFREDRSIQPRMLQWACPGIERSHLGNHSGSGRLCCFSGTLGSHLHVVGTDKIPCRYQILYPGNESISRINLSSQCGETQVSMSIDQSRHKYSRSMIPGVTSRFRLTHGGYATAMDFYCTVFEPLCGSHHHPTCFVENRASLSSPPPVHGYCHVAVPRTPRRGSA